MEENGSTDRTTQTKSKSAFLWVKFSLFLVVLAAFAYFFVEHREKLTLKYLADREATILAFKEDHPVGVYAAAFAIYVVATGLSLPGALILTLVYGWYFDFLPALILISFASTTGATIAFLLSRYFFRDAIQNKFGDRLRKINEALETEGAFYLFYLRLIPAVPFFVINAVMGLTPIRVWTYWWVSQLGMLAGTCVFVYAGNVVPTLGELEQKGFWTVLREKPQILGAFIVLAVFPIVIKKIMAGVRPKKESKNE